MVILPAHFDLFYALATDGRAYADDTEADVVPPYPATCRFGGTADVSRAQFPLFFSSFSPPSGAHISYIRPPNVTCDI